MLVRISDQIGRFFALLAAVGVLVMMLHICLDIVLRALFSAPIAATVEIVSRYYMVLVAFLPLAWLERRNGMVNVELLDAFMSGPVRRISDIAVAVISAFIYAALTYANWITAVQNYVTGTFVMALTVPVPVWPTYFILPAAFLLATLVATLRAMQLMIGEDRASP